MMRSDTKLTTPKVTPEARQTRAKFNRLDESAAHEKRRAHQVFPGELFSIKAFSKSIDTALTNPLVNLLTVRLQPPREEGKKS